MHICSEPVLFRTEGTPHTHAPLGGFRRQQPTNWTSSPCGDLALTCVCVCALWFLSWSTLSGHTREYAYTARMNVCVYVDSCVSVCVLCVCVSACTVQYMCQLSGLPSGRTCNKDKLLLLASRGLYCRSVPGVCVFVCGLCYTKNYHFF